MPIAGLGLSVYKGTRAKVLDETAKWVSRVTTAGGTISSLDQQTIYNYFEKPIAFTGLRNRIKVCYLFVGSGINTHKVPYIGSVNATAVGCTDANFTSAGGFTGNGTSSYLNLNVSPASLGLTVDNIQLIVYGTGLGGTVTRGIIGSTGPSATRNILYREGSDQSYRGEFDANQGNIAFVQSAVGNGMFAAQSPTPAMQSVFINGFRGGFDVNSAYRTGTPSTGNVIVSAYDNAGSIILFNPASIRFIAVTEGMTDFEMAALNQIVDQYNARLSRSAVGSTAQSLIVTKPYTFHTYQRSLSTNKGDIKIEFYYAGAQTTIEARWKGGAWTPLLDVAGTGFYRGILADQNPGEGTLDVRAAIAPGTVVSKTNVKVGDVVGVFGQSNAAGQFNNPQPYSHPTLTASKFQKYRNWEEYSDPSGAYIAGGSVWGRLATLMMAYTGVPVGFITCAVGSTALVAGGAQWNATNGTVLDQAIFVLNQAESNGLLFGAFHLGESDTAGTSTAAFKAEYYRMLALMQSRTVNPFRLVVAQIGTVGVSAAANIDNIRRAIAELWNEGIDTYWGPLFWDLVLADSLHLTTDAQAVIAAARWMRAIQKQVFKDPLSDGRGPRYLSGSYAGTTITITLRDGVAPLTLGASPATGWAIADGSGARTISNISLVGASSSSLGQIQITVSGAALSGTVTVSLGSGNAGAGNTILDSGAIAPYPIEPFSVTL